jgi:hypothetical protein
MRMRSEVAVIVLRQGELVHRGIATPARDPEQLDLEP